MSTLEELEKLHKEHTGYEYETKISYYILNVSVGDNIYELLKINQDVKPKINKDNKIFMIEF